MGLVERVGWIGWTIFVFLLWECRGVGYKFGLSDLIVLFFLFRLGCSGWWGFRSVCFL